MTEQLSGTVAGTTEPGFEPVATEFERLLAAEEDARGQFCAYLNGRPIVDLWGGGDVSADDLQGVFSSTKGASAICIALLVQRGELGLDTPVARYWPEFGANGKAGMTVRIALSHQAGLVGVEPQLSIDEMLDHPAVAARLAAALPAWRPGTAHGYHALTIGTLMDELTRRTAGVPIADYFRTEIGDPRGIDVYIRTPAATESRVKPVLPMQPTEQQRAELEQRGTRAPDSLAGMAFNAAVRPESELLSNLPSVRRSGQAAAGAVCSARGLGRLYAMCISEVDGLARILSPETVAAMTQIQTVGDDLILRCPTRYGIVFQKADDRLWFGSHLAFGHDGAGGSVGVADPWHGIAYAWIPRRMSFPGGGDGRGLGLARVLRDCLPAQP
ncbi:MAG: serine hydrolase domain-containing protein [Trebonia sp.]|jgi:CubicO group peptidase (beta-lactamase class C family)